MPTASTAIPYPPRMPFLGNLHQIPKGKLSHYLLETSRAFQGIFELSFAGKSAIFVTSPDLVAELSDERRFRKVITGGLYFVRALAGDGLFTARSDEENWGKAHRILMPAFSQRAMKGYFGAMLEVAEQLVAHWDKQIGRDLHVADDMTRLTFDTIALAGFDYRFNSFASPELHPFLDEMVRVLAEAMAKITRMKFQKPFARDKERQFAADIGDMNTLVDDVIKHRRAHPSEASDLLNLMLEAKDPETGEQLDDTNIRYQILTFLIAGHETTSGLLTFCLYLLLRNPHVLALAYAEVDRVLPGDTVPEYRHIAKFNVIDRILKETLRLWPTAPAYTVGPYENTTLGGKYRLHQNQQVTVLINALQRDPSAWPDPDRFDIDRWTPEMEAKHASACLQAIRQRHARLHRPPTCADGSQARHRADPEEFRAERPLRLQTRCEANAYGETRRFPHSRETASAERALRCRWPDGRRGDRRRVIGNGARRYRARFPGSLWDEPRHLP